MTSELCDVVRKGDHMHVDDYTLRDLEFFPDAFAARGIFALIDRTVMQGGRERLRALVRNPLNDIELIRERQTAVKALAGLSLSVSFAEIGNLAEEVEKYIQSSLVPLPASRVKMWLVGWRYGDSVQFLVRGVRRTAALLRVAEEIGEALEAMPLLATELHRIAEQIRECTDVPTCRSLTRADNEWTSDARLANFDQKIRGRAMRAAVLSMIGALYELDALRSLALASAQSGFSKPEFVDSLTPVFRASGLFHPLLQRPIGSDVSVELPKRLLFITGPNMAGKTTFMKACATSALLAHLGMNVPARSLVLSVYDCIFASLSNRDTVSSGRSYFLAEVRRVRELAQYVAGGCRVFAVVDEMFKGTNIFDATDATRAVVQRMKEIPLGATLVASHITEVARELETDPHVALNYFEAEVSGDEITFAYNLSHGYSSQRLGLHLLRQEGVLEYLDQALAAPPSFT